MGIQLHMPGAYASGRIRRTGRTAPQAASCLLAATMLVAVPAGGEMAAADVRPEPQPRRASAERIKIDAATMRRIRAYKKYKRKLSRQRQQARTAIRFARNQLGKPYRWGGTGPSAYDCSGLVMKAWRRAGVKIPRVTYSQYGSVRRKVGLKSLRPGDLIFFRGRAHVGMVISKKRFIHAPNSGSRIRINRISPYRKRQFAGAVRPGAPAVKKWPESIPRLTRRLEVMKNQDRQEAAAKPAPRAPSSKQEKGSTSTSPDRNPPTTSPQNEAPPGPSPSSPKPESPPGFSDPGELVKAFDIPGREPG